MKNFVLTTTTLAMRINIANKNIRAFSSFFFYFFLIIILLLRNRFFIIIKKIKKKTWERRWNSWSFPITYMFQSL
jgi:hypothetical protein